MSSPATQNAIEEIAIVGMAGRFPGARSIAQFWRNLCDGVESISRFSEEELLAAGIGAAVLSNPRYIKAGALLDDVELFDASFFGFTPREAQMMDPQHRFFLECAWEALENAGYDPERYEGRIGVYSGTSLNSYLFNYYLARPDIDAADLFQLLIGNEKDHLPTKVSYKLNLKGPSINVQTACSTSLVAISLACQSLLSYQCDMALAGGVSIRLPQKTGYFYQEGSLLSPDGHCRAFDAKARGTMAGSGIGIILLKRLSEALAEGDYIHAVIKSSAVNNDGGVKVGYTSPGVDGQAEVIAEAISMAGVSVESIGYVETHGTGTVLGDPVEIAALSKAFRLSSKEKGFSAVGSVKTNIGHLDAAAGVAGLIKTVEALKHAQLPPSLHYENPNPNIDFASSPFYVNTKLREWTAGEFPRRAGVSSFGIGGTNAHVILEEPPTLPAASRDSKGQQLLVLSARTATALQASAANLAAYLKEHTEIDFADTAYTLQVGRRVFTHRLMCVCEDASDAIETLETQPAGKVYLAQQENKSRPVVMMFPGQGTQQVRMASGLYASEPVFREHVDLCAELLRPHLNRDLRGILFPEEAQLEEAAALLGQTALAQPALFTVEFALAKLWESRGVSPAAMIGHSIGEYVAACLSGVYLLEDALSVVAARGRLMQELPHGAMLAVALSEIEARSLLTNEVSLAAVNSPNQCVLSGSERGIEQVERQLSEEGVVYRRLQGSQAFHSQMLDAILDPFTERVKKVSLKAPQIPFVSTLTGDWITNEQAVDPLYWVRQLREPVRFAAAASTLLKDFEGILLEVGPGQTLSALVNRHPEKHARQQILHSLPSSRDKQADATFLLGTLGQLWLAGVEVDWPRARATGQRRRIPLPTYPFERQHYWIEPEGATANIGFSEIALAARNETVDSIAPAVVKTSDAELAEEASESQTAVTQTVAASVDQETDYAPPSNVTQQVIADIWQEVFGIEAIGVNTDFFSLGGNSLIGIQLMSRIRKTFDTQLPMSKFFESPTIAGLASMIEAGGHTLHEQEELERLLKEIEDMSPDQLQSTLSQEQPLTDE